MSATRDRRILLDPGADGPGGAALLLGGRLEDLLLDPPPRDPTPVPGEIYRARVDRLVPKLGAAFVRLAPGRMGYLREAKGVREGQSLTVEVVSYPEEGKASPVTRRLLFRSRTVIHTPDAPGINISRQIRDADERARLQSAVEAAVEAALGPRADPAPGLILRSAAAGATASAIAGDLAEVLAARERVEAAAGAAQAGGPLIGQTAMEIAAREWDGEAHLEPGGFAREGVRDEIDRLADPRTALPSGGWISVEPTHALVAVDVNTGGGFAGAAGLTAALEAARELPRQLRLRGLGGMVVVDFPPVPKKDRRRIEDALATAFRRDPIETSLAGWTALGLFELQRKRERRPLADLLAAWARAGAGQAG